MASCPEDSSSSTDNDLMIVARLRDLSLEVTDFEEIKNDLRHISLPALQYGYPVMPFTWDQLKNIILVEHDLAKLARSACQQRNYEIFRYCLRREYASMLDYVLITKFDVSRRRSEIGRLWHAFLPSEDYVVQTRLVENDFPYFMSEGIIHYILWKTREPIHAQDIDDAKAQLGRSMQVIDSLHWTNPPHLQSLPDIDHVHILCRLADTIESQ
jgi:Protein of unknown function (DUF3605)